MYSFRKRGGKMATRQGILTDLKSYESLLPTFLYPSRRDHEEFDTLNQFHQFIETTPACFERTNHAGHITGSALVTDETMSYVLLTLHAIPSRGCKRPAANAKRLWGATPGH